jgi:hypothetical protein
MDKRRLMSVQKNLCGFKTKIAAQRMDKILLPASTLQAPNGNVMNEGVNYSIG